jgi:hypothetical protein
MDTGAAPIRNGQTERKESVMSNPSPESTPPAPPRGEPDPAATTGEAANAKPGKEQPPARRTNPFIINDLFPDQGSESRDAQSNPFIINDLPDTLPDTPGNAERVEKKKGAAQDWPIDSEEEAATTGDFFSTVARPSAEMAPHAPQAEADEDDDMDEEVTTADFFSAQPFTPGRGIINDLAESDGPATGKESQPSQSQPLQTSKPLTLPAPSHPTLKASSSPRTSEKTPAPAATETTALPGSNAPPSRPQKNVPDTRSTSAEQESSPSSAPASQGGGNVAESSWQTLPPTPAATTARQEQAAPKSGVPEKEMSPPNDREEPGLAVPRVETPPAAPTERAWPITPLEHLRMTDEVDLWWGSYSGWSMLPSFSLCILATALIAWLSVLLVPASSSHLVIMGLAGAVWIVQLTRWAYRVFGYNYRLTSRRIYVDRGWLYSEAFRLDLMDIARVKVVTGSWQGIIRAGNVLLEKKAQGQSPLLLEAVRQPRRVVSQIEHAAGLAREAAQTPG